MDIVECFDKETNTCKVTNICHLKHFLYDANQAFIESLNQHTLADAVPNKTLFLEPLRPDSVLPLKIS